MEVMEVGKHNIKFKIWKPDREYKPLFREFLTEPWKQYTLWHFEIKEKEDHYILKVIPPSIGVYTIARIWETTGCVNCWGDRYRFIVLKKNDVYVIDIEDVVVIDEGEEYGVTEIIIENITKDETTFRFVYNDRDETLVEVAKVLKIPELIEDKKDIKKYDDIIARLFYILKHFYLLESEPY